MGNYLLAMNYEQKTTSYKRRDDADMVSYAVTFIRSTLEFGLWTIFEDAVTKSKNAKLFVDDSFA